MVDNAQAAQAGLVTAMGYDLERALNTVDLSSLRRSLPSFTTLVAALVRRYALASATLAARAYRADRTAAGIRAPFTVTPADGPSLPQIAKTVDWATQPLWAPQPDTRTTLTNLEGATGRLVLDTGRRTIIDNVHRDRHAKAWARIPEPGCCYFCALLAIRGAVYKETTVGFKAHDHCKCHPEPVFIAYEPSSQVREWQALYRDKVQGGPDLLKTWRRTFDEHAS